MPHTKAIVIKQYKQLAGILDLGDEVTIVPTLSTEPKVVCREWLMRDPKDRTIVHVVSPEVIAPVGTMEGYTFVAKDGNTYSDKTLEYYLGYVSLEKIFAKA